MRDDRWRDIADRIESIWPGEPGLGDSYRDELDALRPEVVEAAIDALLIEHRNAAPSPSAVRRAAEDLEAEVPVEEPEEDSGEWSSSSSSSSETTPPPPPGPAPAGEAEPAPEPGAPQGAPRKATLALILGAVSFITLPLVVAIIAILVSRSALRDIERQQGAGGQGRAQLGQLLGWVSLIMYGSLIVIGVIAGN